MRVQGVSIVLIAFVVVTVGSLDCSIHETCDACTSEVHMPHCGWCADLNVTDGIHCWDVSERSSCLIFHYPESEITSQVNDGFTDRVLIQPSAMSVQLRPGFPIIFNLQIKPIANYPVDIYYLMDLSGSMHDDITTLKKKSKDIANWIKNLNTAENHFGFGSFVEKTARPFSSDARMNSGKFTYLFKNTLPLQNSKEKFIDAIEQQTFNGNWDIPEGGMDALLQAAVCTNEIGWRNFTRRIIFFSSDADFHFGGDGKMLGITEPNDGTCRLKECREDYKESACKIPDSRECQYCMDSEGGFLDGPDSTSQDYPTIGQIQKALEESNITPIFAISSLSNNIPLPSIEFYKRLQAFLGFGEVIELASDSSNIATVLETAYRGLLEVVRVTTKANGSKGLVRSITIDNFNSHQDPPQGTKKNVKVGQDTVEFIVTLQSIGTNSILDPVILDVSGLTRLIIEVIPHKKCSCIDEGQESTACNGKGTIICGKCECNDGYYGPDCGCHGEKILCNQTILDKLSGCNGQGTCVCGRCDCQKEDLSLDIIGYTGDTCQCPTCRKSKVFGAEQIRKEECGGLYQGECKCGTCHCTKDFTNSDCSCPTGTRSDNACMPNIVLSDGRTPEVCNGAAECNCGLCGVCSEGFSGKNCLNCDEEILKSQGKSCPKVLECKSAKTCSECFDINIVGTTDCNWCPGDSTLVLNHEYNKTLSPGCYPASIASSACFCSLQRNSTAECNLHTSKEQCANCELKTSCETCKAAIRTKPVGLEKASACEWCGDRCIEYELKLNTCDVEDMNEKVLCDLQCVSSVLPETCDLRKEYNSLLLDFACNTNGDGNAVPPFGSSFEWPWCYHPENVPDDFCENEDWILLWASRCPKPVNKGAIIGGVLGGILGSLLVALLVWKLITQWKDKKEWSQWEMDRSASKWQASHNPLFQSNTTEYVNPTYTKEWRTLHDLNIKYSDRSIMVRKRIQSVTLHTTVGDIKLELYCRQTPQTCENFLALCASGYYDNVLIHRNIRGFMVQMGDPTGTGKGGQSIWGHKFADELVPELTHSERGVLSMANSGPNTNASQFFLVYKEQPHLDGKYTIFGRMIHGDDILDYIEKVPVDGKYRPVNDIRIRHITIHSNPIADES